MKNTFRVLGILAILAFAVMPPGAVQAADAFTQVDLRPVAGEEDPIDWHCVNVNPDGTCPADGPSPYVYNGAHPGHGTTLIQGQLVCEGWGCSRTEVYVQVDWNAAWSSPWDRYGGVNVEVRSYGSSPSVIHTQTAYCGSGHEGDCEGRYYYALPASEISMNPADTHITVTFGFAGTGTGDTEAFQFEVTLSGEPIDVDTCDDEYQAVECSNVEIDPTLEDGVVGDLVVGEIYRIEIGGSWNDGTSDRYDMEYSFDEGTTWLSKEDLLGLDEVECIQNVEEKADYFVIYLTAPSTTLTVRAADTEGDFADNTDGMTVSLCSAELAGGSSCVGQFTAGSEIFTGTIPANTAFTLTDLDGDTSWMDPGEWYILTTSGGPWQDGGSGSGRYDIEMTMSSSGGTPTGWESTSSFSGSNCMTTGGEYVSVYYQASSTQQLYLRVADAGGVFAGNTGSMNYSISGVDEYNAFPSGCAISYDINNLVETRETISTNGAGITLMELRNFEWPVWPFMGGEIFPKMMRFLVLETFGVWYDNGVASIDGQMKEDDAAWQEISVWDEADCVEEIDPMGHVRVYFDAYQDRTWKFRVDDSGDGVYGFVNNSGRLGYNLYWGVNYDIPLNDTYDYQYSGFCSNYYEHDPDAGITLTLYGNNASGYALPLIQPNEIVAVQVTGGPWSNSGVSSYEVGISDNNGASYTSLNDYAGTQCIERSPDEDHPLAYIYGRSGSTYRLRVFDEGLAFGDNSGSIQVTVYPALADDKINVWDSCAVNYDMVEVPLSNDQRTVSAGLESGVMIPMIEAGKDYAIEITGETLGWGILGNLQAELNNGGGWEDMPEATFLDCVVAVTNETESYKDRYRVYFTADNNTTYRIRANAAAFIPNNGTLMFRLYKTAAHSSPTTPGYNGQPFSPSPYGGCGVACIRPGGLFTSSSFSLGSITFGDLGTVNFPSVAFPQPNVGGWIDYGRCSIITYLAWCDEHTEAINQVMTIVESKEPYGTFNEFSEGYQALADGIDAIITEGGEPEYNLYPESMIFGGATGGETSESLYDLLKTNNPMFGGEFDFTGETPIAGGASDEELEFYESACLESFEPVIGNANVYFCWYMGMLHKYPWGVWVLTGIQLLFDFLALYGFMAYIQDKWVSKGVPA